MKQKISIGILAHNESSVIRGTLQSLLQQSLFSQADSDKNIEIIVVANGCTDNTVAVARSTLEELGPLLTPSQGQWTISEIEQPGLANAWNQYIHEFSRPESDYLIVMSADIKFLDPQTLTSLISTLEAAPEIYVSVDKRIKDVELKSEKRLADRLSIIISSLSGNKPQAEGSAAWISGQLYCSRAQILREIWMPTTLPTDDAFLYQMIVTRGFTQPEDRERVILAKSASHVFEAYTQFGRLWKHEKWLIFGQVVNQILYEYLWSHNSAQNNIGRFVQEKNALNPFWLNQLVKDSVKGKGLWIIPKFIVTRRFQSWLFKPVPDKIWLFPLVLAAFMVDLLLAIQVNFELRFRGGMDSWKSSGSWGK